MRRHFSAILLFTIVAGVVFFYALFIFQATLSFWAVESLEISGHDGGAKSQ